jgi:membrane-bound metal-dependent hydrolase YbcI (DUF457 family)
MKGIVHFLSGVAVATFFPEAVNLAATQSSFILVLGGIGGLLPDTLDFRLSRFLEKPDVDIAPHPANPNPQDIAERVAEAINRVAATGQKLILQLRTMRLGPDLWQQYSLRFDVENSAVIVKLGPVVNTSQMPLPEGMGRTEDMETRGRGDAERGRRGDAERTGVVLLSQTREGRASVNAPLCPTYGEETTIDIFGGPSFALEWRKGQVEINFIPWHRQWSHALTLAAMFGLFAGILFGATAGALSALAYAMHIAEDQLGFLGSNLFYPFTRRRSNGLKWIHSGDPVPNFFTVWTMLVIILFNLDRFSARPQINPLTYFGFAWLPMLLLLGVYLFNRHRTDLKRPESLPASQQTDLAQELLEVTDT